MSRIGFEVQAWSNRPFNEFSDEELLEYWYKMRIGRKLDGNKKEVVDSNSPMGNFYLVDLQEEILKRMQAYEESYGRR